MQPERIEFPVDYPIKVVVRTEAALRERIDAIFSRHFGSHSARDVGERRSAQGHFLALTYVPHVASEAQLRALHAELAALEGVLMVL